MSSDLPLLNISLQKVSIGVRETRERQESYDRERDASNKEWLSPERSHHQSEKDLVDLSDAKPEANPSTPAFTIVLPSESASDEKANSVQNASPVPVRKWQDLNVKKDKVFPQRVELKELITKHPDLILTAVMHSSEGRQDESLVSVYSFNLPKDEQNNDTFGLLTDAVDGMAIDQFGATNAYYSFDGEGAFEEDQRRLFDKYIETRDQILHIHAQDEPKSRLRFGIRKHRPGDSFGQAQTFEEVFVEAVQTLEASRIGIGPLIYGLRFVKKTARRGMDQWDCVYLVEHGVDLFQVVVEDNETSSHFKALGKDRTKFFYGVRKQWNSFAAQTERLLQTASKHGFLLADNRLENMIVVNTSTIRFIDFDPVFTTTHSTASAECLYILNALLLCNVLVRSDIGNPEQPSVIQLILYLMLDPILTRLQEDFGAYTKERQKDPDAPSSLCEEIMKFNKVLFPSGTDQLSMHHRKHMTDDDLRTQSSIVLSRMQHYGRWGYTDVHRRRTSRSGELGLSDRGEGSRPTVVRIMDRLFARWQKLSLVFGPP